MAENERSLQEQKALEGEYAIHQYAHPRTGESVTLLSIGMMGTIFVSRDGLQALIADLQHTLAVLSEDDMALLRRQELVEEAPAYYRDVYGDDDPVWLAYRTTHPVPEVLKRIRRTEAGFIYVIEGNGYVKIGCSKAPMKRFHTLSAKAPFPLETVLTFATEDMYGCEKALHAEFAHKRTYGEWFALTADDIATIRQRYMSQEQETAHGMP